MSLLQLSANSFSTHVTLEPGTFILPIYFFTEPNLTLVTCIAIYGQLIFAFITFMPYLYYSKDNLVIYLTLIYIHCNL